ncbi:MotA/TolQ/ExbB proton channel family protein [Candidatus Symbiobacter mobilis]|uniref:MotA/TolQ/ExbB proton channel family protein n=1 Tax=Candidatus Symbiobacter mobilis TaxID=1436290 RepID=UPI00059B7389|nr:MotA/TolQ/ExbB proton channel family protein [Candidatus Symbiobacter mobilis]
MFAVVQAAGWPVWPLVACSVWAVALIIDRFLCLRPAKVAPASLLNEVLSFARTSVPSPDVVTQLERNSALGEVLASGLRTLNADPKCSEDELRSRVESTGRIVAHRLERNLTALATIASAAPLMGLFGTVVGMIELFGSQGPGAGVGGNPAQLAHGISVALYNTAFGLLIAIPSLIFWRYFRARVDAYLLTLEVSAERLLHHLNALRQLPRR